MRKKIILSLVIVLCFLIISHAFASYTKLDLEKKSDADLIELILVLLNQRKCSLEQPNYCTKEELIDLIKNYLKNKKGEDIENNIMCNDQYNPVCGVDNKTYSNECFAKKAGVGVQYNGSCKDIEDDVEVDIMAYIQEGIEGVNIENYLNFIDEINDFYQDNELNILFKAKDIEWYKDGEDCKKDLNGNDVIMCVGPDKGGYLGSPYFIAGANTNSPFGFTDIGVRAEAHELAHFLGFQDLYWFRSDDNLIDSEGAIFKKDIMYDPYDLSNGFTENTRYVLDMNAKNLLKEGNTGIVGAIERVPKSFTIYIGEKGNSCNVYKGIRNYSTFKSEVSSVPIIRKDTNDVGYLKLDNNDMKKLGYNSNEIDFLYIDCGTNVFWLNSLVWEDCYKENGAYSVCNVDCVDSNWCRYKK